LFLPYAQRQFANEQSRRAVSERWEWDGKELGLLLKAAFSKQRPLLAVSAAGCLPYWSELPALDMLGLNDHYLPRHPPPDLGSGRLGHELGDGRYVLGRNPDIIVFGTGEPPHHRSGEELQRMPEFHRRFARVHLQTGGHASPAIAYFNKHSEKVGIGIVSSGSTVTIPGFLFTGASTLAYLNGANRLVTQLRPGQTLGVSFDFPDMTRSWRVEVRASSPLGQSGEVLGEAGPAGVVLRSTSAQPIEIEEVTLRSGS
jgi:hypothetical protein